MKHLKMALACGLVVASAAGVNAKDLLKPNPAVTHNVTEISTVLLQWAGAWPDADPTKAVTVLKDGEVIRSAMPELDMDAWDSYCVTFSPAVTEEGVYTMVVPENIAPDNSNPRYEITYAIGQGGAVCEPQNITPEPGSDIVQGTYYGFSSIRMEFNESSLTSLDESKISLRSETGTNVPFTINGVYSEDNPMIAYVNQIFVTVNFNEDGNMDSGTYTLTILPGAFTAAAGANTDTYTYSWNYTKTKAEADPTPITVSEFFTAPVTVSYDSDWNPVLTWDDANKTDLTNGAVLAMLREGDGILVDFNHAAKSGYVDYEVYDCTSKDIIRTGEFQKLPDGKFFTEWPADLKFFEGTTYEFTFHAYDQVSAWSRVEFGQGHTVQIQGASQAYNYSPYIHAAESPANGSVLASLGENKVTLVYSGKVNIWKAQVSLGFGVSQPVECQPKTPGEEYDYVWVATIPENIMEDYNSCNLSFWAKDQEGRAVKTENGDEDNCYVALDYDLTLMQPRIMLNLTDSHQPGLEIFRVHADNNGPINHAWMGYPELRDAEGNTVATIDEEYGVDEWGWPSPYNVTKSTGGSEPDPLELEFRMVPPVTAPGKYILHFDKWIYAFGTQFDGTSSIEQDFTFYVAPFVDVTYTVDNHTMVLPQVEKGLTASIEVMPADGWRLDTLTLNGEDVTDNVQEGRYTTPALNEAAHLAAYYAFDGAIAEPTGVDDVVTDFQLRAWSEDGAIYVAGLHEGMTLDVYTAGGSRMASLSASGDDTVKVTVPAGVYVLTVTDGSSRAAVKVINQ